MENFNQSLSDTYRNIHDIDGKNIFVTYINKHERSFMNPDDLKTLKMGVGRLKKFLEWKKKQILEIVSQADLERVESFFNEMKNDNRTAVIVKKSITRQILKKFKEKYDAEILKENTSYQEYAKYLAQMEWELKSEKKIVTHIVDKLKQQKTLKDKLYTLMSLEPSMLAKIPPGHLQEATKTLFSSWKSYYNTIEERQEETPEDHPQEAPLYAEQESFFNDHNDLPDLDGIAPFGDPGEGGKSNAELFAMMERMDELTQSIMDEEESNREIKEETYQDLGKMMAGDKNSTPEKLIFTLAGKSKKKEKKSNRIQDIVELLRDIETLPNLMEKITTVKFWVDNHYYSAQPHIHNFLIGQLEALYGRKAREGGLMRRIFDELNNRPKVEAKIKYLEEVLKDPEYIHLISMINNLINNFKNDIRISPANMSETLITNELQMIDDPQEKLDYLKIRRSLPGFEDYVPFLEKTIKEIETTEARKSVEKLEDAGARKEADLSIKEKQKQGIPITVHKNVMTLVKELMPLPNKVARQKFIKEQELLHPEEENSLFSRQRKLLFYLLSTEQVDKPRLMLQALAGKALLTKEEKLAYFKLLKLSSYAIPEGQFVLARELGIDDRSLGEAVLTLLGEDKTLLRQRMTYYRSIKEGSITLPGVKHHSASGEEIVEDFKDFFKIDNGMLDDFIARLQKKIAHNELDRTQEETWQEEETNFDEEFSGEEPVPPGEEPADISGEEAPPEDISLIMDSPAEDSGGFDGPGEIPGDKEEQETALRTPADNTGALPLEEEEKIQKPGKNISEKPETLPPGEKGPSQEQKDKFYMQQKQAIDEKIQQKIEEVGEETKQNAQQEMKKQVEEVCEKHKDNPPSRLESILRNLTACQPELIVTLIKETVIPSLKEQGDTETIDILTALNQNLFSLLLYSGATVSMDEVIQSIETLLKKEGVLNNCLKDLETITQRIQDTRKNHLNEEVSSEMLRIQAINRAVKQGDIRNILVQLNKVNPPSLIISALQDSFIAHILETPRTKELLSKLNLIKEIISSSKEIDWGEYFDEKIKDGILELKEKYTASIAVEKERLEKKRKEQEGVPPFVDQALSASITFVDPHKVIKTLVEDKPEFDRRLGGRNKENRDEVIQELYNLGKIFTYDDRYFIGYGKIYDYVNDKDNIGYPKEVLAKELLTFLEFFPSDKERAAFMGVNQENFEPFMAKLALWAKKAAIQGGEEISTKAAAQKKKKQKAGDVTEKNSSTSPGPTASSGSGQRQRSGGKGKPGGTKKKSGGGLAALFNFGQKKESPSKPSKPRNPGQSSSKSRNSSSKSVSRRSPAPSRGKKTTPNRTSSGERKLTAKDKDLLKQLSKMITDKLTFLIKESGDKEMLQMLYKSYIASGAKPELLFKLLDPDKIGRVYNSIKDDTGLHQKLFFDKKTIKKLYEKKKSKMK